MAFTLAERQALGIHGLIPPRFKTQEEQVELCLTNLKRYAEDLNKYIYLMGLQVCDPLISKYFKFTNNLNMFFRIVTSAYFTAFYPRMWKT